MPQQWNQRYSVFSELPAVCYGLQSYPHLIPNIGVGLDLACGLGQNSIFLKKHGLKMYGWDYSLAGLEQMKRHCALQEVEVNQRCIDLVNTPWPNQYFDFICVTAFLDRILCPQIVSHLKPGGILLYQTFNQVTDIAGESLNKPRRTQFLIAKSELLELFSDLVPLLYHDEQDLSQRQHPLAGKALLIARKPLLG